MIKIFRLIVKLLFELFFIKIYINIFGIIKIETLTGSTTETPPRVEWIHDFIFVIIFYSFVGEMWEKGKGLSSWDQLIERNVKFDFDFYNNLPKYLYLKKFDASQN